MIRKICLQKQAFILVCIISIVFLVIKLIRYNLCNNERKKWKDYDSNYTRNGFHVLNDKSINTALSNNVSIFLKCIDPNASSIEDTFCVPRPKYMKHYKNPCWTEVIQEKIVVRCFPYFHILGVDKCGTTDLFSRILWHPDIIPNSGALGKEIYYWCWLKYGQWMRSTTPPANLTYYIKRFHSAAVVISQNVTRTGQHHIISGDGTPMDFWDFRAWPLIPQNRGLQEPMVLTPHLMKHLYRDPKFIIIMRDPVERLYSDYIFLGYGYTPEKFGQDVPRAIHMMKHCLDKNTIRKCVFHNDTYVQLPMRIHIGMYVVFLKEWFDVFPRSNFYILRTEDYEKDMLLQLTAIFDFLKVDRLPPNVMTSITEQERKHQTKRKTKDMLLESRLLLREFYAQYNRQLAALLNDTRFLWDYGPS